MLKEMYIVKLSGV